MSPDLPVIEHRMRQAACLLAAAEAMRLQKEPAANIILRSHSDGATRNERAQLNLVSLGAATNHDKRRTP